MLCTFSLNLSQSLELYFTLCLTWSCQVLCHGGLFLSYEYFQCILTFIKLVELYSFCLFSYTFAIFLLCLNLVNSLLNNCSHPQNRIYKRKLFQFLMLLVHYYKCANIFSILFLIVITYHLFFLILMHIFFLYLYFLPNILLRMLLFLSIILFLNFYWIFFLSTFIL